MSQNERKPRKEPTALDDWKLRLFAKPIQDGAKQPSLRVKLVENNPCIEVDLGIKTEGKNGREGYPISIETPMEPITFQALLDLIKRVANFKGQVAFELENWGKPFIWDRDQGKNVRAKEAMVISRFSIGKRDDGTVFFGVAAKNKPSIEFEFKSNEWHQLYQNGAKVTAEISSSLAATAWANAWAEIYFQHFTSKWEEPAYLKQRRLENAQRHGGGGGGYQGQPRAESNSPAQVNAASAPSAPAVMDMDSFDEDLPF